MFSKATYGSINGKKNEFKLSSLKQISQELELYVSIKNKYIHVLVIKQQEHINPYMLCVT